MTDGETEMRSQDRQKRRLLIVDDNKDAATSLAYLVAQAGYEVEVAFSGAAALELVPRFEPEVCLLDINMPGMDGYELARQIRERAPNRSIVLATMTAYSNYQHLDQAVDAGFDLHFTKPTEIDDLVQQLDKAYLGHDKFST